MLTKVHNRSRALTTEQAVLSYAGLWPTHGTARMPSSCAERVDPDSTERIWSQVRVLVRAFRRLRAARDELRCALAHASRPLRAARSRPVGPLPRRVARHDEVVAVPGGRCKGGRAEPARAAQTRRVAREAAADAPLVDPVVGVGPHARRAPAQRDVRSG